MSIPIISPVVHFLGFGGLQNQKIPTSKVREEVFELIHNNPVLVVTKKYSPSCISAKKLLSKINADAFILNIDEEEAGSEMFRVFCQLTNQSNLPIVFIGRDYIGGRSELYKLHKQGELENWVAMVKKADQVERNMTSTKNSSLLEDRESIIRKDPQLPKKQTLIERLTIENDPRIIRERLTLHPQQTQIRRIASQPQIKKDIHPQNKPTLIGKIDQDSSLINKKTIEQHRAEMRRIASQPQLRKKTSALSAQGEYLSA